MKRVALMNFELENADGSKQRIKAGETVGFTLAQFAGLVEAKRIHSDEEMDRQARAEFEKMASSSAKAAAKAQRQKMPKLIPVASVKYDDAYHDADGVEQTVFAKAQAATDRSSEK